MPKRQFRLNPNATPFLPPPLFSRINKPTLPKSRFPTREYTDAPLRPTAPGMPALTVATYRIRMKNHHLEKKDEKQRNARLTPHKWHRGDSGTWHHPQVPGAFDYFTKTYNMGYIAHCVACARDAKRAEKKWDRYPDLAPLVAEIKESRIWRLHGSCVFLPEERWKHDLYSQQVTVPVVDEGSRFVVYICGNCCTPIELRQGEPIRCRDCGHGVLFKQRTDR